MQTSALGSIFFTLKYFCYTSVSPRGEHAGSKGLQFAVEITERYLARAHREVVLGMLFVVTAPFGQEVAQLLGLEMSREGETEPVETTSSKEPSVRDGTTHPSQIF